MCANVRANIHSCAMCITFYYCYCVTSNKSSYYNISRLAMLVFVVKLCRRNGILYMLFFISLLLSSISLSSVCAIFWRATKYLMLTCVDIHIFPKKWLAVVCCVSGCAIRFFSLVLLVGVRFLSVLAFRTMVEIAICCCSLVLLLLMS